MIDLGLCCPCTDFESTPPPLHLMCRIWPGQTFAWPLDGEEGDMAVLGTPLTHPKKYLSRLKGSGGAWIFVAIKHTSGDLTCDVSRSMGYYRRPQKSSVRHIFVAVPLPLSQCPLILFFVVGFSSSPWSAFALPSREHKCHHTNSNIHRVLGYLRLPVSERGLRR